MGNCLCEGAGEYMAYNRLHGPDDPWQQPHWLRRHHPPFLHDGIEANPGM